MSKYVAQDQRPRAQDSQEQGSIDGGNRERVKDLV